MKVYIMTDFEGVSGVRTQDECSTGTPQYEAARKFLVGDVNAAIAGAFDGGADEVLVRDGHGKGFNFLLELMDERAVYVGNAAENWLPHLDDTVDAAFFVGAHAMAGTQDAFLDHTQSYAWYCYAVNGRAMGEQGQMGLIAGTFGVPMVLVTGDEAACAEARAFFPGCATAAVKRAEGRQSACCLHPMRAQALIRAAAQRAVGLAKTVPPMLTAWPAEVTLEFGRTDYADGLAAKRGVERIGPRTVKWLAANANELLL
jgi:D-amino peptidase